jgi:hypothetical protein
MSGLTVADVFDLLAEHAECVNPTGCKVFGYDVLHCPQHAAIEGKRWTYRMPMVPQKYLPLASLHGHLTGWGSGETPRVVIAVLLWRITAEYMLDREPLHPAPGQTITQAAEQYVRDHWGEAEGHGIAVDTIDNQPISRYLDSLSLYDDDRRVRNSDQHKAFANPEETR